MKITQTTVLNAQQKQAHLEAMTKGKSAAFKTNFNFLHIDVRSYAVGAPDGSCAVEASKDMLNCVTGDKKFGFTADVQKNIDALGLNVSRMYRAPDASGKGCNMKTLKRFHQMMNALAQPAPHMHFDVVSCIILLALDAAGDKPLARDALFFMGTGKNMHAGMSANTRGVSRATITGKLSGFVSVHGETMKTQISRSVGADGFLSNVGAVERIRTGSGKNDFSFSLNRENPLAKKVLGIFDGLTLGQVDAFIEELTPTK